MSQDLAESKRSFGETAVLEFCEPLIDVLFVFNYCCIKKKSVLFFLCYLHKLLSFYGLHLIHHILPIFFLF